MNNTARHYEEKAFVPALPEELFALIDDHKRFSAHMGESSWMMGGGSMGVEVDSGLGQKVGSHIKMTGTAFGMRMFLDEVVTRHEPPFSKTWETVGAPKLVVVGSYAMGIEIKPQDGGSMLRVFIDYDLPQANAWLGRLFGGMYAKWCVRQMIQGVRKEYNKK